MSRRIDIPDKAFSLLTGYTAEIKEAHGKTSRTKIAGELIEEGLRVRQAGLWANPLAKTVKNVMREVCEAERMAFSEELSQMTEALEGRALEVKAAALAMLLACEYEADDIEELILEGIRLATRAPEKTQDLPWI